MSASKTGTTPLCLLDGRQVVKAQILDQVDFLWRKFDITLDQLYPGFDLNAPAILAPIEAGIKPLCDALNGLAGVFTLWSCEGHPEAAARPFVTFIAEVAMAFKIHKAIGLDGERLGLYFCWHSVSSFRNDGAMQYTIEPNDYRISVGARRRWWAVNRWDKQVMANDLERLSVLVAKLRH